MRPGQVVEMDLVENRIVARPGGIGLNLGLGDQGEVVAGGMDRALEIGDAKSCL